MQYFDQVFELFSGGTFLQRVENAFNYFNYHSKKQSRNDFFENYKGSKGIYSSEFMLFYHIFIEFYFLIFHS